jgi:hypothetical protein
MEFTLQERPVNFMQHLYRGRVVGVSHRKKELSEIVTFMSATPRNELDFDVRLVAEVSNPFDATAIAVYFGQKNGPIAHVGYIPKENTAKIHAVGVDKVKVELDWINQYKGEVTGLDILVSAQEE